MNCREVKQLLYQYIENDLDKDTAAGIKKHFSECKDCASELAFARKYKQEMSLLKSASAPADFLRTLNQRIDSGVNKKSFLSRIIDTLFFPLKIKLPFGAAGLLTAIILVAVFFNPADKSVKSVFVQTEKEYAKKDGKAGAGVQIAKTEHIPKEAEKDMVASNADMRTKTPSARMESRDLIARADVYEIAIVIQDPQSPQQSMPRESVSRAASGAMVEEKEGFKGMDDIALKSSQKGVGDSAVALKSQESISMAERKKEKANERMQDRELAAKKAYKAKDIDSRDARDIQSQTINVQNSISEIKRIALGLNGKVIGEELNRKDNSNLLIVEIPAANQQIFIDKLNRVGSIKAGEQRARVQRSSNVQYNINVMQAK